MQKILSLSVATIFLIGCDSEGIQRNNGTTNSTPSVQNDTVEQTSVSTQSGDSEEDNSINQFGGSGSSDGGTTGDNDINQFGGSGSSDGGTTGDNDINQFGGSGSSDGGESDSDQSNDAPTSGTDASASASVMSLTAPTTGTTFVSTMSPLRSDTTEYCIAPSRDENDEVIMNGNCPVVQFHPNLKFGDFILSTNAWNFCASSLPDWKQCISVNDASGAVVPRWDYDWGNESDVRGAVWLVKSYPEIIYGVKSPGEYSGPSLAETPAATGMPVRVDELPFYKIDYAFSSAEFPTRSKVLNGQTLNGERNVAVESFFHELGGDCDVNTLVRNGTESNQRFEIMLWLDRGAERLPAAPGDFVTSVSLDGKGYDVYTKPSDEEYIAFVSQNPTTTGEINWNTFIEWTRTYSHRVNEVFGTGANTVQLQDDWCMANILVGTEIWWGNGYFQADNWTIHRTVQ